MKTVLFGKKIEHIFTVNKNKKNKQINGEICSVYTDKPKLTETIKIVDWIELCSYEGEPRYNNSFPSYLHSVNISKNETVKIIEEIFRADLNEVHLFTSKVVKEKDIDKEKAIIEYKDEIRKFNKAIIESNNKLKSYCDLAKLSYEDIDCIELFKFLFSDDYEIKDGIIKEKNNTITYNPSSFIINTSENYNDLIKMKY